VELSVNGHNTFVYTGGKPFGVGVPTVVFIHGAQQDHSCWLLQSRWFAHHGYGVLAPDLPGHGRSAGAPLTSVEALADWIIALLDDLGVQQAGLIGHSMGSMIALDAASRYAQRVTAIALIATAVPMPVSPALLGAAKDDEPRAMNMVNVWSHSPHGHVGLCAVPGIWMYTANLRLMERQKPGVMHIDLAACNAYARGSDATAQVRCPTLVLAGAKDQMTSPKVARGLAGSIQGAKLVMLEGAGHAMMTEQPDAVLDTLRDFFAANRSSQATNP
jgi:pimeloyl-ACP methyl ester carboxylesterase